MGRKIEYAGDEWDPEDHEGGYTEWEEVKSKPVLDYDGFYTDYTMWYNQFEEKYVFTFGDKEIYYPENSDWDWECETEEEADEWFDNYVGPGEEDDEEDYENDDIYSAEDIEKLDATEIVWDMHRSFPEVKFIGELDVLDGVNLDFECKIPSSSLEEKVADILEKLDSYGYDYEYDTIDPNHDYPEIVTFDFQINGVPGFVYE